LDISEEDAKMDLSNLKPPKGAKHRKTRVGRGQGSGNGKTAGRGHKGAKSRSGFKFKRGFEGGQMPLHRRVPKRGFHNHFRVEYEVVNLDALAEKFEAGTVVTPELLREFGEYRFLTYGIVLVIMMRMKPLGLWPSNVRKRELQAADEAAAMMKSQAQKA